MEELLKLNTFKRVSLLLVTGILFTGTAAGSAVLSRLGVQNRVEEFNQMKLPEFRLHECRKEQKKFRKELRYKWPSTASEELKNAESDLFGNAGSSVVTV